MRWDNTRQRRGGVVARLSASRLSARGPADCGEARWWAPLAVAVAPGLVGWVVGLVLLVHGDEHVVHLYAPAWVTVVTVGLVLTVAVGAVAGLRWLRARHRRTAGAALDRARQQWEVEARVKNAAFLARLDEEVKGPALVIRSSVAALGRGTAAEPAKAIATQSARIAAMATDLGSLIDVENRDLDPIPVELVPVIERAVGVVRDELPLAGTGPRDISVLAPPASRQVVVAGAEDLLFRAVHQLVSNAVKFSDPGASVTVHCVEDGDGVVVEVADNGWGIPDLEVLDVWEPLARASNAGQTRGSGIGLPLVRAIVERHGGRVDLSSRLGEGTSVVLWLPVAY